MLNNESLWNKVSRQEIEQDVCHTFTKSFKSMTFAYNPGRKLVKAQQIIWNVSWSWAPLISFEAKLCHQHPDSVSYCLVPPDPPVSTKLKSRSERRAFNKWNHSRENRQGRTEWIHAAGWFLCTGTCCDPVAAFGVYGGVFLFMATYGISFYFTPVILGNCMYGRRETNMIPSELWDELHTTDWPSIRQRVLNISPLGGRRTQKQAHSLSHSTAGMCKMFPATWRMEVQRSPCFSCCVVAQSDKSKRNEKEAQKKTGFWGSTGSQSYKRLNVSFGTGILWCCTRPRLTSADPLSRELTSFAWQATSLIQGTGIWHLRGSSCLISKRVATIHWHTHTELNCSVE